MRTRTRGGLCGAWKGPLEDRCCSRVTTRAAKAAWSGLPGPSAICRTLWASAESKAWPGHSRATRTHLLVCCWRALCVACGMCVVHNAAFLKTSLAEACGRQVLKLEPREVLVRFSSIPPGCCTHAFAGIVTNTPSDMITGRLRVKRGPTHPARGCGARHAACCACTPSVTLSKSWSQLLGRANVGQRTDNFMSIAILS
jgi:hypothetical protein